MFFVPTQSLVLLTRLPFVQLFHEICAVIAPLYFDEACSGAADVGGLAVLDEACAQIGAWPALVAGRPLTLPLLGTVWCTEIAARNITAAAAVSNALPTAAITAMAAATTSNNNGDRTE